MRLGSAIFFAVLAVVGVGAQERLTVADGTRSQIGAFHLLEAESKVVREAIGMFKFGEVGADSAAPCGATDLSIRDYADGRFEGLAARTVLYWRCDDRNSLRSGIIVLAKRSIVAQTEFGFGSETKLAASRDIDGDGSDELVLYSFAELTDSRVRSKIRILKIVGGRFNEIGELPIHSSEIKPSGRHDFVATRLYADPGPNFFAEEFTLADTALDTVFDEKKLGAAGKSWRSSGPPARIEIKPGTTKFEVPVRRFVFADVPATLIATASALFIILIPFTVWAFFRSRQFRSVPETESRRGSAERSEPKPKEPETNLQPLKCSNCGAGVALGERIVCDRCGSAAEVPEGYAELGRIRSRTAARIAKAERYLRRAGYFSSDLFVSVVSAIMLLLAFSAVWLIVRGGSGSYVYYRAFFSTGLFGFGILATAYWLFTLLLFFPVRSGRVRSMIPAIGNTAGTETSTCPGCGGAVRFESGSVAGVCGYCGVETYRARVAWELRKISNEAHQRASFSLIEAARDYSATISNIIYTPLAAMLVALIPAVVCVLSGLIG